MNEENGLMDGVTHVSRALSPYNETVKQHIETGVSPFYIIFLLLKGNLFLLALGMCEVSGSKGVYTFTDSRALSDSCK